MLTSVTVVPYMADSLTLAGARDAGRVTPAAACADFGAAVGHSWPKERDASMRRTLIIVLSTVAACWLCAGAVEGAVVAVRLDRAIGRSRGLRRAAGDMVQMLKRMQTQSSFSDAKGGKKVSTSRSALCL